MHELSMIKDLIHKIEEIAKNEKATQIDCVRVKLGALAHCSPEHFQEHYEEASLGSIAHGAKLDIELLSDESDPNAQVIRLESVDVS